MLVVLDYIIAVLLTALTVFLDKIYERPQSFWLILILFLGYLFISFFVTFLSLFLVTLPIKRNGDFGEKHSRFYRFFFEEGLTFVNYFMKIKIHLEGKEKLPSNKKERMVFMSNHISKFDPMTCNAVLKGYDISWIGKRSLFSMPLINRYLYKICFMPIDREDLKQSLKVIRQSIKYIEEDQCSIGIYPEGTRNTTEDPVLPCKAGSMKIAYLSKTPIVVMTVVNTDNVVKNFLLKRTHVYIRICKVIPYEEYKDMDTQDLASYVEKIMKENILEIKNNDKYKTK